MVGSSLNETTFTKGDRGREFGKTEDLGWLINSQIDQDEQILGFAATFSNESGYDSILFLFGPH